MFLTLWNQLGSSSNQIFGWTDDIFFWTFIQEVEFGSTEYYIKCCIGGSLSCGLTHTIIVPLDLVKCRMQVDSVKYPSIGKGFKELCPRPGFRFHVFS